MEMKMTVIKHPQKLKIIKHVAGELGVSKSYGSETWTLSIFSNFAFKNMMSIPVTIGYYMGCGEQNRVDLSFLK